MRFSIVILRSFIIIIMIIIKRKSLIAFSVKTKIAYNFMVVANFLFYFIFFVVGNKNILPI